MKSPVFFSFLGAVTALPALQHDLHKSTGSLDSRANSHTLSLKRIPAIGKTSSASLRRASRRGQSNITSAQLGQDFLTDITFGSETRKVVIDTGSSDTWLIQNDFTCVNFTTNATAPEQDCYFGSPIPLQNSFVQIADENFNISYADGEFINGHLGYEELTLAGVKIPKQEVAMSYLAAWHGDGISSGLLGLAFPSLTMAFNGTDPAADQDASLLNPNTTNRLPYSSIMETIFFVEKLTDPLFTLALSRDGSNAPSGFGGILEIGAFPDLHTPSINASEHFAHAPIQFLTQQFLDPNTPEYQFYTITIDGLMYQGSPGANTSAQYFVDSGTTLLLIPSSDAARINSLFVPPAKNVDGTYLVACNATPPAFGVTIGGATFPINPRDMVIELDPGANTCVSGVQDGGPGPYILGDVFLVNVLAIFDLGRYLMHFSSRQFYA